MGTQYCTATDLLSKLSVLLSVYVIPSSLNQAGWQKYSKCEKAEANGALYGPLKAAPCEAMKKDEAC